MQFCYPYTSSLIPAKIDSILFASKMRLKTASTKWPNQVILFREKRNWDDEIYEMSAHSNISTQHDFTNRIEDKLMLPKQLFSQHYAQNSDNIWLAAGLFKTYPFFLHFEMNSVLLFCQCHFNYAFLFLFLESVQVEEPNEREGEMSEQGSGRKPEQFEQQGITSVICCTM